MSDIKLKDLTVTDIPYGEEDSQGQLNYQAQKRKRMVEGKTLEEIRRGPRE